MSRSQQGEGRQYWRTRSITKLKNSSSNFIASQSQVRLEIFSQGRSFSHTKKSWVSL